MLFQGSPSDSLPNVLAIGSADIGCAFTSFSGRDPDGRDAEYIAWHSLDHRPEQYRLAGLKASLRLVSTPQCRNARAASEGAYDAVDHVMTYMFRDMSSLPAFNTLGKVLNEHGRMPLRLPSIGYMTADFAGKVAAASAVAGSDVLPWRPAMGVYLIVEEGNISPADLVDVPGVAGVWWFSGSMSPEPFNTDARGRQISYCYLDRDPLSVAAGLKERMLQRWSSGAARGLLAAPFFTIVPFEWSRYLPRE